MNKIILSILIIFVISCKKTIIVGFHDKPVVESYLFADSIPLVKISKLVPFDTTMQFSDFDVAKLQVTITDQNSGKNYLLSSLGGGIYKNQNLVIAAGSTYHLSFPYNRVLVTATTTVPPKPRDVKFSALAISISQTTEPGSGSTFAPPVMPSLVDVTWTNDDQGYYLLVVKNLETNKVTINTRNNFPLTEINANIVNGYGIFTALNAYSVDFYVNKP